jgi:hypothetical protein
MSVFGNFGPSYLGMPSADETDVFFAVQDFVTGTTTGVQTFTSATISGMTPKGVMLFTPSQFVADASESAVMNCGIGFVQGTNDVCGTATSRDNNATTQNARIFNNNTALAGYDATGNGVKDATGSTASGGVALDFTTNGDVSYRYAFTAFAGTGVSCYVGSLDLGAGSGAIDVTGVGFAPDVILAVLTGSVNSGSVNNDIFYSFGIITNESGTYPQRCFAWAEANGAADGAPFMSLSATRGAAKISTSDGTLTYDLLFNNFDADGFDVTPSSSSSSNDLVYMALKFNGSSHKLVAFDTPTSTGSSTITGAGFTPRYALIIITNLETVGDFTARAASDLQGGWSISSVASDEQWSASHRIEVAATTNTGNQLSAGIIGPSAADCDAIAATFTAWTSDGVTLNFTAVQGTAKKGFVLFVE